MVGDEEEYVVLLVNYFFYMKKIIWFIIGKIFIRLIDVVEKIIFKKKLFKYIFSYYRVIKVFFYFFDYIYIYDGIYIYIYKMMIWFFFLGKGILEGFIAYVMIE